MTTPRRFLQPVPDPADDNRPRPAEEPTAAETLPAAAVTLVTPADVWQAPDTGVGRDTSPGAPFLAMVERAEKVAPIHADTAELKPDALLQMIGGVAGPPAADDQRAAEAALERLAGVAWDVIRIGAADDEPELRTRLVELCTRFGMDPEERPAD